MVTIYDVSADIWDKVSKTKEDKVVKYPWSTIKLKQMFEVKKADMKPVTLHTYISKKGKEYKKKFKAVDWNEHAWLVVCIEDNSPVEEVKVETSVDNLDWRK